MKFYEINAGFLKDVSSTSSGDTASRRILNTTNIIDPCFLKDVSTSRRILNTTNIIDPSYQLRCTAYMLRNKDKPVSANFCCQQSTSFTCQDAELSIQTARGIA
ncbi:hypothetical protein DPMN_018087 [Dreissena polymorpha]|uniref:Uncharacterized protein n=1 Tax=Dreissena polymorpha TaxID=45954 RepID=A0A9D4NGI3_DREPO|nr:hypothetical protein DPMN_018087 [Dreissena polymorpha]